VRADKVWDWLSCCSIEPESGVELVTGDDG
jgi:hypothetical protein